MKWRADPSVCVVLAAAGYPGAVQSGDKIAGVDEVESAIVFHAGTKLTNGELVTSGGRVLGVTTSGPTLSPAIHNTYEQVQKI